MIHSGNGNVRARQLACAIAFACVAPVASAAQLNADWIGGNDDYGTAVNWSGGVVPTNTISDTFIVTINNGSEVSLSAATVVVDELHLGSADSFVVDNAADMTALSQATLDGASLLALNASTLNLSAATSYTGVVGGFQNRELLSNGAGSRIDLSGLLNFTRGSGTNNTFEVTARTGGAVDLSGLAAITDAGGNNGRFRVSAEDALSLVDLSGITSLADDNVTQTTIAAVDGGEVRVNANFNSLTASTLTLRNGGIFNLSAITNYQDSRVILEDGQVENLGVANIDGTSLIARKGTSGAGGAILTTSSAAYVGQIASFTTRELSADGPGSRLNAASITSLTRGSGTVNILEINASDGGVVDLSSLSSIDDAASSNGRLDIVADGAGSLIDISGITGLADDNVNETKVTARDGGEVRVNVGFSSFTGGTLTLRNGGIFDHSAITDFQDSLIIVEDGQIETFAAANINGTSLIARKGIFGGGGAQLTTSASDYVGIVADSVAREIIADGPGSRVNAASITSLTRGSGSNNHLDISAADGGVVDLSSLSTIDDAPAANGRLTVLADDAGSLVDLSGITALADDVVSHTSVTARDGGEVRVNGGFNSFTGSTLTLRNGGIFDHSAITNFQDSVIALEDGQVETLANANINGTSLIARKGIFGNGGTQLTTSTSSYVGIVADFVAREMVADGAGSHLDASSITSLTRGSGTSNHLDISATDGGVVDLSSLSAITDAPVANGRLNILAEDANSLIDLSGITSLNGDHPNNTTVNVRSGGEVRVNGAFSSLTNSTLTLADGGIFNHAAVTSFENSVLAVEDGHVTTFNAANIDGTSLIARDGFQGGPGAQLTVAATAYTGIVASFADREFTADGAGTRVNASSLTQMTRASGTSSTIRLRAIDGGHVDLSGLAVIDDAAVNSAFIVIDADDGTVDLSALTSLTNASVNAEDDGQVDLSALETASGVDVTLNGGGSVDVGKLTSFEDGSFLLDVGGTAQDIRVADTFYLGALGVIDVEDSSAGLVIGDPAGAAVQAGAVNIFDGGSMSGVGTVIGELVNHGMLDPGSSPGTLFVDGDYSQSNSATVTIEVAGHDAGDFDVLAIAGSADLDGTLAIELLDASELQDGDILNILVAAGGITNAWTTILFPQAGSGFEFDLIYTGIAAQLHISAAPIPVPAAVWLLASAGLLLVSRRRQ